MTDLTMDPEPFEIVPHSVMNALAADPGPLALYMFIRQHYNHSKKAAWPSQERLAKLLSVSERTIVRWLKVLETANAITVTRSMANGHRAVNRYHIFGLKVTPVSNQSDTNVTQRVTPVSSSRVTPVSQEPYLREPYLENQMGDHALTLVAPPTELTLTQIADQIAKAFYDAQNGAVNFQKIRQVLTTMLKAGHDPESVAIALAQAEDAGKPLTSDVLRQILKGRTGGRVKSVREKQAEAGLADYFQRRQSQ